MLRIGVIGLGHRMNGVVGEILKSGKVTLAAVTDLRNEEIRAEGKYPDVHYYDDAREMIEKEHLDGVCIGTRCPTHAHFMQIVSEYGLPVFLEKPVAISYEDMAMLKRIEGMNDRTVVSFPLRVSRICTYVKELLDRGVIGEITHMEAYNNVNYGAGYYHKWYRHVEETGGQFLQKATHDLDYICYLLGEDVRPVRVCAVKSKVHYGGTKPAAFRCADCPDQESCMDSPIHAKHISPAFTMDNYEYCAYAEDVTIEDSDSCIVEFDNGVHVVYTQDFLSRKGAGQRGARLTGYYGTIEFDWYTGRVTVWHHTEDIIDHIEFDDNGNSHFGGDEQLVKNFIAVMEGKDVSKTKLSSGILSDELCLACRRSAEEHVFVDIEG